MVNKQGQTRLAEYCEFMSIDEWVALEAEIIPKCLSRTETQVRGVCVCVCEHCHGESVKGHPLPPPSLASSLLSM